MDPLSIGSGVAGLITLVVQVRGAITEYVAAVKNKDRDVRELLNELELLAQVLGRLREFVLEAKDRDHEFDEHRVLDRAIADCKTRIERIQEKLKPITGGKLARFKDKIMWPFKQEEIQQIVEKLQRFKHTFQFAFSVQGYSILLKTTKEATKSLEERLDKMSKLCEQMSLVDEEAGTQIQDKIIKLQSTLDLLPTLLQKDITEINQTTKAQEERDMERRRTEILNWLLPESDLHKHRDVQKRRAPGTGQWLVTHPTFNVWSEHRDTQQNLLCVGGPGRGKTVLCSLIIDELSNRFRDDPTSVVAHYYCDDSEREVQSGPQFASCILRQLCEALKNPPSVVTEFWLQWKTKPRDYLEWFSQLQATLSRVLATFSRCFIVIDALDETEPREQRKGLFEVLDIVRAASNRTKIFATTRPSLDIEQQFNDRYQIDVSADERDIRQFLSQRIDDNPYSNENIDTELKEEIVTRLSTLADGMFLLPALQIDDILGQVTKGDMRRALRTVSTSVREAFDKTIRRINGLGEHERRLAHNTLMWISHARCALTTEELQHALAIRDDETEINVEEDLPTIRRILDCCCGLVEHDRDSSYIRLVHYSLKEYLTTEDHGLFADGELKLTRTCLRYLAYKSLKEPGFMTVNRHEFEKRIAAWPLIEYAATYWGHHAEGTDVFRYQDLARPLLSNNYNVLLIAKVRDLHGPQLRKWSDRMLSWAASGGAGISLAASYGLAKLTKLLIETSRNPVLTSRNVYGSTALHECAFLGYRDTAEVLIEHGADILDTNIGKATPLYLAVSNNQNEVTRLLLKSNAIEQLDIRCKDGFTVLHKACDSGNDTMAALLIEAGASVFHKDDHGRTPLHLACKRGHLVIVQMLIDAEAVVDAKSNDYTTPLHIACTGGHLDIVRYLLEHGASIGSKSRDMWTPIHRAARTGSADVVQLLLAYGADVMVMDHAHRIPLTLAVKAGSLLTAEVLLSHSHDSAAKLRQLQQREASGADIKMVAFYTAQYDMHKYLRDMEDRLLGQNPMVCPPEDLTLRMTHAIEEGSLEAVQSLVQDDRSLLHKRDPTGLTPLHTSFLEMRWNIAWYLLEQGVPIDIRGYHGWTPLHIAASRGSLPMLELALQFNADVFALSDTRQTALHKAASANSLPILVELLRCGSELTAENDKKMTAVHIAAKSNWIEGVQILLQWQSTNQKLVLSKDGYGKTPRKWAELGGFLEMSEYLETEEKKAKGKVDSRPTREIGNSGGMEISRQSTTNSFLSPSRTSSSLHERNSDSPNRDAWDGSSGPSSPFRTPTASTVSLTEDDIAIISRNTAGLEMESVFQ